MQTRKASKLISLLKVCIFVTFASAACNVYAEYYLVYSAPCPDCYAPPAEWRPYHVRHHAYVKHHRCRYARNYAYDVRVIVPLCPPPPPPPCMSCYPRSNEFVEFNTYPGATGHGRYVINEVDTNDPDMSTGDDDASIHPDMDIDY